jgi:hypothetical protein
MVKAREKNFSKAFSRVRVGKKDGVRMGKRDENRRYENVFPVYTTHDADGCSTKLKQLDGKQI